MIGEQDRLVADEDARERLQWLLNIPLTNYEAERRTEDPQVIRAVLAAAASPRPLGDLAGVLAGAGLDHTAARATVAWMLKYDLLLCAAAERPGPGGIREATDGFPRLKPGDSRFDTDGLDARSYTMRRTKAPARRDADPGPCCLSGRRGRRLADLREPGWSAGGTLFEKVRMRAGPVEDQDIRPSLIRK